MTTNHHTAHSSGATLNNTTLNSPLSELDSAITTNATNIAAANPTTTKGDISTYSTAAARLPVGTTNGQVLTVASGETTGLLWAPGVAHFAIIRDEKTSGTDGGSSSATTWNVRDLNTEASDLKSLVTISTNQFTPIAGNYYLRASAPAFKVNGHRLAIYNVTGTAYVDYGASTYNASGNNVQTRALMETYFTANGTDAYELRHYTAGAQATTGLGNATSDGSTEIYAMIFLQLIST